MMLQEDRHQRIRALLATVGRATTDRIATDLGVSRETVRRDVLALEARGELRRVHGGVAAIAEAEPPIAVRARVRLAEKTRIAQAAARLVSPGQTLFLDVGSTVSILARELATLSGLTIVTNSFEVATIIGGSPGERSNRVIVLGGELGQTMPATFGSTTVAEIQRWQADVALLSPVGIDHRYGATSFDIEEANVARAMTAAAKRVLILADHSKIGQTSRVAYCAPDRIDGLITDARAADDAALGALRTVIGEVVIA